jgi:hypothetical protein
MRARYKHAEKTKERGKRSKWMKVGKKLAYSSSFPLAFYSAWDWNTAIYKAQSTRYN